MLTPQINIPALSLSNLLTYLDQLTAQPAYFNNKIEFYHPIIIFLQTKNQRFDIIKDTIHEQIMIIKQAPIDQIDIDSFIGLKWISLSENRSDIFHYYALVEQSCNLTKNIRISNDYTIITKPFKIFCNLLHLSAPNQKFNNINSATSPASKIIVNFLYIKYLSNPSRNFRGKVLTLPFIDNKQNEFFKDHDFNKALNQLSEQQNIMIDLIRSYLDSRIQNNALEHNLFHDDENIWITLDDSRFSIVSNTKKIVPGQKIENEKMISAVSEQKLQLLQRQCFQHVEIRRLGNQYLPSAGKTECACLAVMFPKQNLEIIGRFIDGEDGDTEKAIIKARLGKLWGCEYEVVISKTPGTKKWELQQ